MATNGASLRAWMIALLFVGICAGPAAGDDAWQRTWREGTGLGRVAKLETMLTADRLDRLLDDQRQILLAAFALDYYAAPMSRTQPKAFGELLERMHAAVKERAEQEGSAAGLRAAHAVLTATRCRHRHLTGHKKPQPEWREAAEDAATLSSKERVGWEVALRAPLWLGEAAQVPKAKYGELLTRAKEMLEAAQTLSPPDDEIQRAWCAWYLARARAGRVQRSKPCGKTAVLEGLEFLKPHLAEKALPPDLATLHTGLAAENKAARFGVKLAMREKDHTLKGGIHVTLPESGEWKMEKATDGGPVVVQRMLRGRMRRQFVASQLPPKTNMYVDPDQERTVMTTKPKEIASAMLSALDRWVHIDDVQSRVKPHRAKLHKDFTDIWRICVEGITEDGRWMRVHEYYFKGKKTKLVYRLRLMEYQRETEDDPVAEFVIKSVRLRK